VTEPREERGTDTIAGAISVLFDILGWLGGMAEDAEDEVGDAEVVDTDGAEVEDE